MQNQGVSIDKLQVAAFDWDNTLACSREALVYSINQILPLYNLPDWDVVKQQRNRNLSFRDNFPRIFGVQAEEAYERYRIVYKNNAKRFLKRPDKAQDVLLLLKQHKVKIAIVSNKDRELFDFEMPFLYDSSLFDAVVCGHEAQKDKPYPEQLEFAVKGLINEINSDKVWMVGDSPMDSMCALSAGAKAIRIGKPIWGADDNDKNSDILFIDDFKMFWQMLKEQNR